ncbi:MAG: fibronectin type III domain-containing protein [Synergistaceae bacterium]|nr:fibronectin type III domain-containing protein [Synergistaceae bacterium]
MFIQTGFPKAPRAHGIRHVLIPLLVFTLALLPSAPALAYGLNVSGDPAGWYWDGSDPDVLYITQSGEYVISSDGQTTDRIIVKRGVTAYITLDSVDIEATDGSALEIQDNFTWAEEPDVGRSATLYLILSGDNKMTGGRVTREWIVQEACAGLYVPYDAVLIISGDGSLTACGSRDVGTGAGAGIGGNGAFTDPWPTDGSSWGQIMIREAGTITINSGTVKAYGGDCDYNPDNPNDPPARGGAGIGGGYKGAGHKITINGGSVEARGGRGAAGIGSTIGHYFVPVPDAYYHSNPLLDPLVVLITGGVVKAYTAEGGGNTAGIGDASDIGGPDRNGAKGLHGSFTLSGDAVVTAVVGATGVARDIRKGILLDETPQYVYTPEGEKMLLPEITTYMGGDVTLLADLTIPAKFVLQLAGGTLTIAEGVTLTVEGSIDAVSGAIGKIVNDGSIVNDGTILYSSGMFTGNEIEGNSATMRPVIHLQSPIPNGRVREEYSLSFDVDCDVAVELTTRSLPNGLTLNSADKVISGMPNAMAGEKEFTLKATNKTLFAEATVQFTLSPDVPLSPDIDGVEAGDTKVGVILREMTAEDMGGAYIVSYDVDLSDGSAIRSVSMPADPPTEPDTLARLTMSGLTNGTEYKLRVRAWNSVGSSDWSGWSEPVTPLSGAILVPGKPRNVAAVAGNGCATVSFLEPEDNGGSIITDYIVTPSDDVSLGKAIRGANSPITVTSLTNGTAYRFRVEAVNVKGSGPSEWSSEYVTPSDASVPGAPRNVRAVAGDKSATVSFNPPKSDGGSAVTGYVVAPYQPYNESKQKGQEIPLSAESRTTTIDGLRNGSEYFFTVRAVNAQGRGAEAWANGEDSEPLVPAAAPSDVSRQSGNDDSGGCDAEGAAGAVALLLCLCAYVYSRRWSS